MPTIFLSHTSIDKPFVEKLANDLKRIGVNVWFDKWEIKVGASLTWEIERGIKENEYLGLVLTPEALQSQWVRSEVGAGWAKQMQTKKVCVLPILHRTCDLPWFLADRKYADFRFDYQNGFRDLAGALGVKETETLSEDNWRRFAKKRSSDWQKYRRIEFEKLVTVLVDRAREYGWSAWVGSTNNPFSITVDAASVQRHHMSVSIKLDGRTYGYRASLKNEWNPNHLKSGDFDIYVGNSTNECEEFVWRHMEDFKRNYGDPINGPSYSLHRHLNAQEQYIAIRRMIKEMSWYKGADLI